MKKIVILFLFCILITSLFAGTDNVITQDLMEKLQLTDNNDLIKINIVLEEQYDSYELYRATQSLSKIEKRQYVINELKTYSINKQADIIQELQEYNKSNTVDKINPLWISNVINCYAIPEVIQLLSLRDDVKSIDWDETRNMLLDDNNDKLLDKIDKQKKLETNNPSREITWNVTKVNADDVWSLGYTGEGVIVAVLDTGVNYNHTDLSDHMWSDPSYPNHGYDFNGNDDDPMDDHGHGTHCAGTVAGDGTSGSQTGMAPDATIMALKILNSSGSGNESDVWDAIQFAVTHGADVMSMSIGWRHSYNPDRASWRTTLNNALAAGLISSVAGGNDGDAQGTYPIPDNIGTPGDCPPPWLNPDQTLTGGLSDVVCVGATDINDNIAGFSSRGPSDWESITGYDDYHYNPEMGLIRPDISAPGVNIKSLSHSSNTGYIDGWNGTSMATPCVAGVMALMIQKDPNITPAHIDHYLEGTVDVPQLPKNNTYGSGRVNALDAINSIGKPICNITNPTNGENIDLGDIVTISVYASDPGGSVDHVTFYIDNGGETTDSTFPYEYVWDTGIETLGSHTIKAITFDDEATPNTTEDEISVQIVDCLVASFPWTEDFENGGTIPDCWSQEYVVNSQNWGFQNGGANGNPPSAHGGSYNAYLYNGSYTANVTKLITPPLDLSSASEATLKFWHTQAVWPNDQDELRVYYKTSSIGSWNLLATYITSITSWTEETLSLIGMSSDYYIGFEGTAQYGYGVCIDDVSITAVIPGQGQGNNISNPSLPVDVDVEPIDIDDISVDPDVNVDPDGSVGITVNITVTDAVQGSTPVPNPDNVIISYAVDIIGTIDGVTLDFDLEFTGLTGLDQIYWLNGTIWEVPNNVSWSTSDHVTFDLALADRNASTEIILSRDDPLPVSLSSFTAIYSNGSPIVNWVTQSESDNIGWNVYRAVSYNFGQAQILNLNTIPGNGTTSEPSFYSFTDEYEVQENSTYWYWLESISGSGETESFGPVSLTITSDGNEIPEIPLETALHQNFPNPFNPSTLISFEIKEGENGILSIYNIKGQLIVKEEFGEGRHSYTWDADNHSSGIYLYKLQAKRYSKIMKMLLVK